VELWPLLKAATPQILWPYDKFSSFAKRFCASYYDGFQEINTGASNTDDLNKRLTGSGFMLRRLKKEVLKDLPDKTYQIIPVHVEDGKLPEKFMHWEKKDAKKVSLGSYDGPDIATFRHEVAREKLEVLIPHIRDLLQTKEKLVVFGYHKDVLKELYNTFMPKGAVLVTGETSSKFRAEAVEAFQNDLDCRVFFGQFQAAGTGITLTAADTCVFAEISWVPGEIFQAVDRLHRIGQKENVLIQFFVVEDSIEEYMLRTVIDKKEVIEAVVEKSEEYIYT